MVLKFKVFLLIVICLCESLLTVTSARDKYPIVKTTNGYIRGEKRFTFLENKPYYSFQGIPYASPPIGDLRYRPPVSFPTWKGVRDAIDFGNVCIQIPQIFKVDPATPYIVGDEDCLFINIYTPDISGNLPVMFWIHGGGFNEGTGGFYGPDFIINENIVLVTFNYRLGPFGFLSLGTKKYSGNMGLKDQIFALKWVNENIGDFGGDKNSITICGESAGGASSHLLTVAKASENLFQRSIMMSGSGLNMWCPYEKRNHVADMYLLARETNPSVRTFEDVVDFVLNVNGSYLCESTSVDLFKYVGHPRKTILSFIWAPVVETPYDDNYFLTEYGGRLIREKNYHSTLDTLFGYTNRELYVFLYKEVNNPSLLRSFNKLYEVQLPLNYDDEIRYNTKTYRQIAQQIHDFYFGVGVRVDNRTMLQYIDLMSDTWFRYPITIAAKIQASVSSGKTFFYEFSVDAKLNIAKKFGNVTLPGASHADELCYLFKCVVPNLYNDVTLRSVTGRAIKNIAKLWTNFVKYGNPTIADEIKPMNKHTMHFFNITNDGVEIGVNPRGDAMALWDSIYTDHYRGFLKTNILNG